MEHTTEKRLTKLSEKSYNGNPKCPTGNSTLHLNNLPPADVYHGRGAKILKMREEIKKQTIRKRRLRHRAAAA